jgi:hypothetical protein
MKRQMKRGFDAVCPLGDLKRWKSQGPQTTIQQSLIDINVVDQELPKSAPKIDQIPTQVKGLKQADASKNFKALCLRQFARPVIIEQHRTRD